MAYNGVDTVDNGGIFVPRLLGVEDAKALADLESLVFADAWGEEQFLRLLGQKHYLCCGIYRNDRLCAYAGGYNVAGELEIVNVAVRIECRSQGLGARIVRFLLDNAVRCGVARAVLEVRRGNEPALKLYARCGFTPIGVRARYYADTGEDALILEWRP